MVKTLALIQLLLIIVTMVSSSFAGSENKPTPNHANYWSGVWQEFKGDWKEIGNNIKDTGANIGHTFSNEFREMPENFRKGYKAAKTDIKTVTASDRSNTKKK